MKPRIAAVVVGMALVATAAVTAVGRVSSAQPPAGSGVSRSSDYLYLWTGSADSTQPDFLAVLDVRPASPRYGRLVTTLPVPGRRNEPHHTEHELASDKLLFANGFESGQSWVFDLSTPTAPRIVTQFGDVNGLMHPHSFWRMPNGHVLATFQMQHRGGTMVPGGLAELTTRGAVIRTASANGPGVNPGVRPYSAALMPAIDRIVTTTTDMDAKEKTNTVQVWRLSDLALLTSFDLPNGPRGDEGQFTAEPRLLPDGKSLLVSTFSCGLYLVTGLETRAPAARLVGSFPAKAGEHCAVPAIVGHYYLVTVPAWSALVSLDIRDPAHPREVSRVSLGRNDVPHWIAVEPNHQRVVITGYKGLEHRVVMATFNETTGQLAIDERFREPGAAAAGFTMEAKQWPHGGRAAGTPHGAVFSRP